MIFRIDKTRTKSINGNTFLLDYVRIKLNTNNVYTFLANVIPDDDDSLPDEALQFEVPGTKYYYMPCIGFEIEGSAWERYLFWNSIQFSNARIEVMQLKEGESIDNPLFPEQVDLKFKIGYALYLPKYRKSQLQI